MTKIGVMICGHGSRSAAAVNEFAAMAEQLPAYLPEDWACDYGYLEFANPVIRVGLDNLRNAGVERILAVPGMLFAAGHAKNDIPSVLISQPAPSFDLAPLDGVAVPGLSRTDLSDNEDGYCVEEATDGVNFTPIALPLHGDPETRRRSTSTSPVSRCG